MKKLTTLLTLLVLLGVTNLIGQEDLAIVGKILDDKNKQKIFDLFYSEKGNKGTGLGLFIAQRSVKQHGGQIRVDSIPDKHTEFTVTIPLKQTAE